MSLLLDALRRAEKAKDATLSTEAADTTAIPLLVEEAPAPQSESQGLSLVDMTDGAEPSSPSTEMRARGDEDGYGSSGPENVRRPDAGTGGVSGGAWPDLAVGRVEARSLFDLNGESALRRRWRWAFIGAGIMLIVFLSVYYGWLLYMAAKPRAGLAPRHLPAPAAKSAASPPLLPSAPVDRSTAGAAEGPVSASATPKVVPIPEAGPPAGSRDAARAGGDEPAGGEPDKRIVAKQPPPPDLSDDRRAALAPVSPVTVGNGAAVAVNGGPDKHERGRPLITISRRQRQDPVFPRLSSAYEAYRAGDYARAEADYRFVLERQPENRDALLGIAALAVSNGRLEEAFGLYRRVLKNSPGDQAALAALTALQERSDPLESERRLKQLLAADPEAPYLYFALGNLHAARGQWSEAQQAYFDAYRRDSENGDYAYNLAVGLDHLGQRQAALRYYRRALEVAGRGEVGFEPDMVRQRVGMLSERPAASVP